MPSNYHNLNYHHSYKYIKEIHSFHASGNSSFFQIELTSLWISERIVLPPAVINSAGIWLIPGDLFLFGPPIAISNSKALGSGASGSAVCMYVCIMFVHIRIKFPESRHQCIRSLTNFILYDSTYHSGCCSLNPLCDASVYCPDRNVWSII